MLKRLLRRYEVCNKMAIYYPKRASSTSAAYAARAGGIESLLKSANAGAAVARPPPTPNATLQFFPPGRFEMRGAPVPLGTRFIVNAPSIAGGLAPDG